MNRKQNTRKQISALILMTLLLIVSGAALFGMDQTMAQKKINARNQAKLDFAAELVFYLDRTRELEESSAASHLQENVRFMTMALAEEKEKTGEISQRLFSDGAVAEFSEDQVIFPDGVLEQMRLLTKDEIHNSVENGMELTTETNRWFIRSGLVSDNLYYVSWDENNSGREDPYACLKDEAFQKLAKQSFSGLLLGSEGVLIFESPEVSGTWSTLDQSVIMELTANQPQTIQAAGSRWVCTYSGADEGGRKLIWLLPESNVRMRSVFHIALSLVSELIIFVTLITYFFSVLNYCSSHELTRNEAEQYHPDKLRKSLLTAAGAGALVVFVCACVFQTMDAIHTESTLGAQELSNLIEYSEKTTDGRNAEEKSNEEQRILEHGKRIAMVLEQETEPPSQEKLQEYCDLFGIDYLILFDTAGREIVSSADYVGLTMDAGLGENSRDFRRLLLGVPAIVHDVSLDSVTGLKRQFMGVRVSSVSSNGKPGYGALLMAMDPQRLSEERPKPVLLDPLSFFGDDNHYCFYADPENGEILRSSDSSLTGKTVISCGLPERSLQEGYTDFAVFNNVSSYATMVKQSAADFFYVMYNKELFSRTVPMASAVLLLFIVKGLILGWYCLKDFSAEKYEALITEKRRNTDEQIKGEKAVFGGSSLNDYSELLIGKRDKDREWNDRSPESQVGTIVKIDVLLLVILPMIVYEKIYGDSSLIRYILEGNWMRGLNMFSFCAIVIVTIIGIMTLIVCNAVLSLVAGLTGRAGETACRMFYSLIYYLVILNILYYVFEYVGLAMSTYVASLGAVSLALSIGAQGMVADILAGLLIVFEHQFQVGDIIEIGGFKGKVLEIGVRSTKILGTSNEIRFISNSDIRSIVNKSIRNSSHTKEYNFITHKSLDRVEELLTAALGEIRKNHDMFLRGPVFTGFVKGIDTGGERIITVQIKYECAESDSSRAENCISREIISFCEREKIGIV